MKPIRLVLLILATTLTLSPPLHAAGKAKHVLIVIMDGLRPDSVTEADMPALSALAKRGINFANHHAVYLATTEVNGAALATGMTPSHTGVVGNREYRTDIDLLGPVDTQGQWAAWKGDQLQKDSWVRAATLPELARAKGLKTVVAGTKGVALLWDRSRANRSVDQPTLFEGKSIPAALLDKVEPELGPIPPGPNSRYFPNRVQDQWTTRVLTEKLWAEGVPALSVLWLSEPDYAQHGSGPGSKNSKAALKSSDDCLAAALAALEQKKVLDATDVLVVSDHGFSTISKVVDAAEDLWVRGFKAGGAFLKAPENGEIAVVPSGASNLFYVVGRGKGDIEKLVAFLQTMDWAGVIFTKEGLEGTFKLSDVGLETADGPDVVVSMRWDARTVVGGMQGTLAADTTYKLGQGMHGSLSRFDMHNTLIAAGPDFKAGNVNQLPTGNSDVAPTVASILGIEPKEPMDGRVMSESLADAPAQDLVPKTTTLEAKCKLGEKNWSQYMRVTELGKQRYYDEGNAGAPPK